jgi:hypothetical protein
MTALRSDGRLACSGSARKFRVPNPVGTYGPQLARLYRLMAIGTPTMVPVSERPMPSSSYDRRSAADAGYALAAATCVRPGMTAVPSG